MDLLLPFANQLLFHIFGISSKINGMFIVNQTNNYYIRFGKTSKKPRTKTNG